MSSSFLCPPSSYSLDDKVIGGVMPRFGYTRPRQTFSQFDPDTTQSSSSVSSTSIGHKRISQLDPTMETALKRSCTTEVEPQRKMKGSATRRERCRINQARYRQRQRQHEEELDAFIRHVHEEIQDLETQRQDILRYAPTNESVWVVATEYFRLFRYGFVAPVMVPVSSASNSPSALFNKWNQKTPPSNVQLEFLKKSMTADVTDGVVFGAEALLENWRLLSLYHDDVHVQLQRLEQIGDDSLRAVTTTSITITKNTLRHVYPHLDSEHSALAAKLLNQRLVMRGTVHFDWDNTSGRVVRVMSKVDALTPMLRLLGSLENVSTVFEKAMMTLEGRFSATEDANDNYNGRH
ncbi:hypothetical protein PR003_g24370 [Phytophthora rubi]|uniref:BZIP domain-containing protein n=1 Tax=Phytophthora rubi TaxID=129364 RepID=A0A6A4CXB4_9STRA|nr:hypothetical protein PR003_g24370 [Phytophthora rubi]